MTTPQPKTVLITGANTGIGKATAEALAKTGARLIFACRSREKTLPVIEAISKTTGNSSLEFLQLDLADLEQVKSAAESFRSKNQRLDVLIENAGLARVRSLTKQGFEMSFGVNHLGHMLLTLWLEPLLLSATPARVVVVASRAHERVGQPLDLDRVRDATSTRTGYPEYARSKLANMLFAGSLARRWHDKGVNVYALHPGVIASEIWRSVPAPIRQLGLLFMRTPEEGARASLHCATSPAVAQESGRYYDEDGSPRRASPLALDEIAQTRLWNRSMEWLAPYLPAQ